MNKTGRILALGLGAVVTGNYVGWAYHHVDGDGPEGPPLASVSASVVGPTGPASVSAANAIMVYDTITDAEYRVTHPSDDRRPATTMPGLPPAGSVADLGVGYPGGIFTLLKKPG